MAADLYDRFGTFGSAGPAWLTEGLARGERRAFIARDDRRVTALIDFVAAPLVAECRFDNVAAVALLGSCGFVRYRMQHGESLWRR